MWLSPAGLSTSTSAENRRLVLSSSQQGSGKLQVLLSCLLHCLFNLVLCSCSSAMLQGERGQPARVSAPDASLCP